MSFRLEIQTGVVYMGICANDHDSASNLCPLLETSQCPQSFNHSLVFLQELSNLVQPQVTCIRAIHELEHRRSKLVLDPRRRN